MSLARLNDTTLVNVGTIDSMKTNGFVADVFAIPFLLQELGSLGDKGLTYGMAGGLRRVELTIGSRTLTDLRLKFVERSTSNSSRLAFCTLHLADRRHYWPRRILSAAYNVKRRSGLRNPRFSSGSANRLPEGAVEVLDEYNYRQGTLKGGKLVTIKDAFIDQMAQLDEIIGVSYILPSDFGSGILAPLEFTGSGPDMLRRIISQAPDFSIYMQDNGVLEVYKKNNVAETSIFLESIKPVLEGGSALSLLNMAGERPEYIDVYFDVEAELLFRHSEDFDEGFMEAKRTTLDDYSSIQADNIGIPVLEGCATNPIRDFSFGGETFAEGSRLKLSTFFAGLATVAPAQFAKTMGPPTYAIWRKHYLRKERFLANYLLAGDKGDELWQRIIGAINAAFRLQYQVAKPWWDLFRAVLPQRSALINPFDLTRAYAPIYTDYLIWPSHRLIFQKNLAQYIKYGFLVRGRHNDPDNRVAAPGNMESVDSEAGVFKVNLALETHGEYTRIFPGAILDLPNIMDIGQAATQISQVGNPLESGYGLATIMTALPYYRQSKRHMFKVRIRPEQIGSKLSQPIGPCEGPGMEVKIPYSEVTAARFVWDDDRVRECIEPFTKEEVEFDPQNLANVGMILDLAQAAAAAIYSKLLDYTVGTLTTTADTPDAKIMGNIRGINTAIRPTGDIYTTYVVDGDFALADAATFLTDNTKAALMRLKLI